MTDLPTLQAFWRKNLADLPSTPDNIPAFFFAHGSPMLAFTSESASRFGGSGTASATWVGPAGPLAHFLKDFGPALLEKYKPKGIVVFSAHWETSHERLVTDYGAENPLLYDYFGLSPELYKPQFKSRGDSALAERVVELYKQAGQRARLSPTTEKRGRDGRGFHGPGLDHGVFVPFRIMFGEEFTDIPIVQVSIDASMRPDTNWALGKAVAQLRAEGILVLSGGLVLHNLRDSESFAPQTARPQHHAFNDAVVAAAGVKDETARKEALVNLTKHAGFRACHPREDHFVPIYVAAGAGEGGEAKLIADIYGCTTIAFGL